MKHISKLAAILFLSGLMLASCKSNNDSTPASNITGNDVTSIVAGKYQWNTSVYNPDFQDWFSFDHVINLEASKKWTAELSYFESNAQISGFINDKNELVIEKYTMMGDGDGDYSGENKDRVLGIYVDNMEHGPFIIGLYPFNDTIVLTKAK